MSKQEDEFEVAFAAAADARRSAGGRPRSVHRDRLVMLAVSRALRETDAGGRRLSKSPDSAVDVRRTLFVEASRILRRDFGVKMSSDAVRVAYYRRLERDTLIHAVRSGDLIEVVQSRDVKRQKVVVRLKPRLKKPLP